jgi:ribosomal protein S18 acetylase RimI-like enzyme
MNSEIASWTLFRYSENMNVVLRAFKEVDAPFLLYLYGTTREDELSHTNFTAQEKDDFIRQQFNAQHDTYALCYPKARGDLIVLEQQNIGRLYVDRREQEIRVMGIALLPEWRNKGVGTQLMNELLREATEKNNPVTLHVEQNNPGAFAWYQRLGFAALWSNETHVFMIYPEGATAPAQPVCSV